MKYLIWALVALLIVLHQDGWNWQDGSLVAGVLPIGLAYHVLVSLAASGVWLLAVTYAWPDHLEAASSDAEVRSASAPASAESAAAPTSAEGAAE